MAVCALSAAAMAQEPSFRPLDTPRDIVRLSEEKERFYRGKGYYPLHGRIESARLGPGTFVLTDDLVVGKDTDVRFSAGSRIACEAGVRISVEGQLIALGSASEPVVFGPLAPDEYCFPPAAPADTLWNGILVEDSATLYLESVHVRGCAAGIDILSGTNSVRLRGTVFTNTGRYAVRVDGKEVRVARDEPVTWLWPEAATTGELKYAADRRWKVSARIGFGIVAAGGAGLAAVSEYLVRKYGDDFSKETADPVRADELHDKAQRAGRMRTVGIVVGGVGGAGFVVTLFF